MNRALLYSMSLTLVVAGSPATFGQKNQVAVDDSAKAEFFERQVRPVLAQHCLACHGPKTQEAGLRLDSRAALLKGSDSGPVVDLQNPIRSRLLTAIGYKDPDLQMPPAPAEKLPDAAIAALSQWIATGAHWPENGIGTATQATPVKPHWAFQPVRPVAIPEVQIGGWPQSPIDRFILAKLEEQGMSPAPTADRATLIRRATFDLVGLPPSEEEIASFVDDPAPDAFARVVDRLLESPPYGERWGRYWLDVARYAETKGYVRLAEERRFPYAFSYRDYVVRSFNEDLPFDRFIVEQLAADQLPLGDDKRPLAALGFLTLGRRFTGDVHDIIDDRIDVVTRGLLGLTVTCARCHDHKYDPIPTADYYSLYGVFASGEDPAVPPLIEELPKDAKTAEFEREYDTRLQALAALEDKLHQALLDEFRTRSADYLAQSLAGRLPPQQPLPKAPGEIRQLVVERWIDVLEHASADDPVFGPWHAFAAIQPEDFASGAAAIVSGWIAEGRGVPRINGVVKGRFTTQPPTSMADVARGYGELLSQVHVRWRGLNASTLAAASAEPNRLPDDDEEELRQVLYGEHAAVAVRKQQALWDYLYDSPINDEIVKRRAAINELLNERGPAQPRAHTLVEFSLPHEPRILVRGNPTRPGKHVPRQFLSALCPTEREPFGAVARLDLARAIAAPDNPLTARVIVNRVWAHHFGAGLVRTPSNFGLRGEAPTHPELLDFLAARFMDEGWSIKKLHRSIMLASVYQQSGRDEPRYSALDPENRLLWKMTRRRLNFEALRDSLLAAAGRMSLAVGGPSEDLSDPGARRRTIYGRIDRQGLPGMLPMFDFASPDAHSPERYSTTVPRQALFLMNGPLAIEMARAFAGRDDVRQSGDASQHAARMMRIAWGRSPSDEEIALALEFITSHESAALSDGSLSAWEALAQTLLLSNEFTYVD
jgi:mono/diheme cytochrome c family protein